MKRAPKIILASAAVLQLACSASPRLVDANEATGFALYRSGRMSASELGDLCHQGVRQIAVLDGSAAERECRTREDACPDLEVRYDVAQKPSVPLDEAFLQAFDEWIEAARTRGEKVSFRCTHGWHRAGRLSAYYQMKYGGLSLEQARQQMHEIGSFMWKHPYLDPQVDALHDYIHGRPCSVESKHCVRVSGTAVDLAADKCP